MNQKGVSCIAALAILLSVFLFTEPVTAAAEERPQFRMIPYTQDEALAWARSQKGELIDVDGWYGVQCVDLIYAYYEFLGIGRLGGNGADYQNDEKLPEGWVRLMASDGAVPKPGDVVVWAGGAYGVSSSDGHVGIIDSVDEAGNFNTLEQNYGADRSVTLNPREAGHFTCVLRPNWKPDPTKAVRKGLAQLSEILK